MSIAENLRRIQDQLPEGVTLVAVSKTKPVEDIQEAYDAGQRIFGENRVQEMCEKQAVLPKDIDWHLIGHLQKNKVKYMAGFVKMIHAVDSFSLLKEINKRAGQNERIIDCLLQMHIAEESTKFGLNRAELDEIIVAIQADQFPHVRIRGFMGMATFTEDKEQIRQEFEQLALIHQEVKNNSIPEMDTLSMGMSGDYTIAIEAGSTMIRVGSSIFGQRNYHQ